LPALVIILAAAAIPLCTLDICALRHLRRSGGVPPTATLLGPAQAPGSRSWSPTWPRRCRRQSPRTSGSLPTSTPPYTRYAASCPGRFGPDTCASASRC
jgi:hypothetical protein